MYSPESIVPTTRRSSEAPGAGTRARAEKLLRYLPVVLGLSGAFGAGALHGAAKTESERVNLAEASLSEEVERRGTDVESEEGMDELEALLALPSVQHFEDRLQTLTEESAENASRDEKKRAAALLMDIQHWIDSPYAMKIAEEISAVLTKSEMAQILKKRHDAERQSKKHEKRVGTEDPI